jgi:DNA-binding beta-propeller fold protein YncE
VHPNGNFLFDSSFGVHVLAIDPTTRGVHELSDSPRAGAQGDNQAVDVAVDPLAQYLYASSNLGTVTAYRIDATTAAFGPVEGSPYTLQGMPIRWRSIRPGASPTSETTMLTRFTRS